MCRLRISIADTLHHDLCTLTWRKSMDMLMYSIFELQSPRYAISSNRSRISFGIKAHTVPNTAMIELTTINNQFKAFSLFPISFPNIRKWNARGKMMQMLNAIAEPINAMIVSKEGTRMDSTTMTNMVKMRMRIFMKPRVYFERPWRPLVRGTVLGSIPSMASMVTLIGFTLL